MGRNLFGIDNARDMHKQELADTFIITKAFSQLLSPKNQIIIGSRGSGKTALLKMICHDHLSLLKDEPLAKEIIDNKTYIGVFMSTKTKFTGGLRNKDWQDEEQKERHFVWQMNVASCLSLLDTLKSCLNVYIENEQEKIDKEIKVISKISSYWFPDKTNIYTIDDIKQALEDLAIFRQIENQRIRTTNTTHNNVVGYEFDTELFEQLIAAINVINKELSFPNETSWFICIDEIEMLEEFHHRILNSYMRSRQTNIYFKYTTLPYCHYTLDTNLNVPLDIRHDVNYIYIDQDKTFSHRAPRNERNALKLFYKRALASKPEYVCIKFEDIFGESKLLDERQINYAPLKKSTKRELLEEEVLGLMKTDDILEKFLIHANSNHRERGIELLKKKNINRFGNEYGRKMRGMLILRDYFQNFAGNQAPDIYSGAKTVIAVGDSNPRKLIKIFNEMLETADKTLNSNKSPKVPLIESKEQNKILGLLADQELNRYKIEKNYGQGLYNMIYHIGTYMAGLIHNKDFKLTSEQLSSIEINNKNEEIHWELVKRAVQKGLLYPNINENNPEDMPIKEGEFHLAFMLAPKFHLLPRKGDARNISRVLGEQLKIHFDA